MTNQELELHLANLLNPDTGHDVAKASADAIHAALTPPTPEDVARDYERVKDGLGSTTGGPSRTTFEDGMAALAQLRDGAARAQALENAKANADEQLQMTRRQVAEVARLLDPGVPPDAWGLHAAAQKVLAERDAARERAVARAKALEERVHELDAESGVRLSRLKRAESERDALQARVAELEARADERRQHLLDTEDARKAAVARAEAAERKVAELEPATRSYREACERAKDREATYRAVAAAYIGVSGYDNDVEADIKDHGVEAGLRSVSYGIAGHFGLCHGDATPPGGGEKTDAPKCDDCGKPAACVGRYEAQTTDTYACNDCCGHGNEDGRCRMLCPEPTPPTPSKSPAAPDGSPATGGLRAAVRRVLDYWALTAPPPMLRELSEALGADELSTPAPAGLLEAVGNILKSEPDALREAIATLSNGERKHLRRLVGHTAVLSTPARMLEEVEPDLRLMLSRPCDHAENQARCGGPHEKNCPPCQAAERIRRALRAAYDTAKGEGICWACWGKRYGDGPAGSRIRCPECAPENSPHSIAANAAKAEPSVPLATLAAVLSESEGACKPLSDQNPPTSPYGDGYLDALHQMKEEVLRRVSSGPVPRVIPEARVVGVLRGSLSSNPSGDATFDRGWNDALRDLAVMLGLSLDAPEEETKRCEDCGGPLPYDGCVATPLCDTCIDKPVTGETVEQALEATKTWPSMSETEQNAAHERVVRAARRPTPPPTTPPLKSTVAMWPKDQQDAQSAPDVALDGGPWRVLVSGRLEVWNQRREEWGQPEQPREVYNPTQEAMAVLARALAEAKRENVALKADVSRQVAVQRTIAEANKEAARKAAEDMRDSAEALAYEESAKTKSPEHRSLLMSLGHSISALPLPGDDNAR